MKRRIFGMIFTAAISAYFMPSIALAGEHLLESISHTKEAIEHGRADHADLLIMDADEGLKHAEAAEKEKANSNVKSNSLIKEGIKHLKASIDEGKKQDVKAATGHAEEALTQLEAATK